MLRPALTDWREPEAGPSGQTYFRSSIRSFQCYMSRKLAIAYIRLSTLGAARVWAGAARRNY